MKKRATLDEVTKNETRYIIAGLALWAVSLCWAVWGPSTFWGEALGFLVSLGAAACLFYSAYLSGRAAEQRFRRNDRSVLFGAGYRIGLIEGSAGGTLRAQRVEYAGEVVYQADPPTERDGARIEYIEVDGHLQQDKGNA